MRNLDIIAMRLYAKRSFNVPSICGTQWFPYEGSHLGRGGVTT